MSDLAPTGAYFLLWCLNIILTMFLWPRPVAAVRNSKFCRAFDPYSAAWVDPRSCLVVEIRSIPSISRVLFRIYLCALSKSKRIVRHRNFVPKSYVYALIFGQWKNDRLFPYTLHVPSALSHHELADYMLDYLNPPIFVLALKHCKFILWFFIVCLFHSIRTYVRLVWITREFLLGAHVGNIL